MYPSDSYQGRVSKLATVRRFLKELYLAWGAGRPTQAAGALAYYGMFSFAPVLFVMLTIAGVFLDTLLAANQLVVALEETLGPETTQFIADVVITISQRTTGGSTLTSLIGFVALFYAASGLFAQLQYALNAIWEVPPPTHQGVIAMVRNRLLAFVMVIGFGLLLVIGTIVSIALSVIGSFVDLGSPVPVGNVVAVLALMIVSLALIYKLLPEADIAWRDVWVGALATALLFSLARWLLALYLASANFASAFDAAGALAVILVAIYYFALIFLFGAVFTKVYASVLGTKAEPVTELSLPD